MTLRMGLLPDFIEENWPSMALCSEMLESYLPQQGVEIQSLRPAYRRRFARLGSRSLFHNIDRIYNRNWIYPRSLRELNQQFDCYHLVDHSYSQLLHSLPNRFIGVFCHDLDTFRCLLEPERDPRPWWFRRLVKSSLNGFRRASVVFYSTQSVFAEIQRYQLVDPAICVQVRYGVAAEFHTRPLERLLIPGHPEIQSYLVHLGSCIPRKRIDLLLTIFSQISRKHPDLKLLQLGGTWTDSQLELIRQHNLEDSVIQLRNLTRYQIACYLHHARFMLLTSESEGFGLPIIEALASGTRVFASDLPVLREVGDRFIDYAPVGEIECWVDQINHLLAHPDSSEALQARLKWAAQFTWEQHARMIAETYRSRLFH